MKAKTKLLLFHVMAAAAVGLSRGALVRSLASGRYGNGMDQELENLEAEAFLETLPAGAADRVWNLTDKGRDACFGRRDPEILWPRPWDGRWRCVLFDLPRKHYRDRQKLRRVLKAHGFGRVQGSVWITPDPIDHLARLKGETFARSLVFFEGCPCGGESAADIVAAAWDWSEINARHRELESYLRRGPPPRGDSEEAVNARRQWLSGEAELWNEVMGWDPLLPSSLHPDSYAGERVWLLRKRVYGRMLRGDL